MAQYGCGEQPLDVIVLIWPGSKVSRDPSGDDGSCTAKLKIRFIHLIFKDDVITDTFGHKLKTTAFPRENGGPCWTSGQKGCRKWPLGRMPTTCDLLRFELNPKRLGIGNDD